MEFIGQQGKKKSGEMETLSKVRVLLSGFLPHTLNPRYHQVPLGTGDTRLLSPAEGADLTRLHPSADSSHAHCG